MSLGDVLALFGEALSMVVIVVAILVLPSLLVGLVVAVFQAATQINEQTLSFLPRLIMTLISIMVAGPWILTQFVDHFQRILLSIPHLIG